MADASAVITGMLAALEAGEAVRMPLTGGGMLTIDRPLPFVLLYREGTEPDAGTRDLLVGEASVLVVGAGTEAEAQGAQLLRALADAGSARFGAFLVIEIWTRPAPSEGETPRFVIHAPESQAPSTIRVLEDSLATVHSPVSVDVAVSRGESRTQPGRRPLIDVRTAWRSGTLLLGLEVPPVYRAADGTMYPVFHRRFRGELSRALRRAIHDFTRVQTNAGIDSYRMLAPRRFSRTVWDADAALAGMEHGYDMLLLIAPMNANEAWEKFRADNFGREPTFHYRLLPFDPDAMKRRLFAIDLEAVTDPALAFLLRDKRDELDKQISLLAERNSPAFLYSSIRLYRALTTSLVDAAEDILAAIPAADAGPSEQRVDAAAFSARAEAEIGAYRAQYDGVAARVQVRPDVTGLMVSRGDVLVSDQLSLDSARVEALLQHEVGTHVLTWYNGGAQPLHLLRNGLADYDELQEGLGVFAEYLVGGLTPGRMRTIAARVIAVESVQGGATFMETFRLLRSDYGLSAYSAFDITERVHESGGFTRDMIYLRGLLWVLDYVRDGGNLEPLYIGKIACRHIDIIAELRERGILRSPPLRPRFLDFPATAARLEKAARGLEWHELVSGINE
jgi:uncharacterized protein (TIGR02421 family)